MLMNSLTLPLQGQESPVSLLKSCEHPQHLHQVHALSIKTGPATLPHSSSSLLSLLSKAPLAGIDYAVSLFRSNPLSWNTIFKCHVDHHRFHDALLLFLDLLRSPVPPHNLSLPAALKSCAQLRASPEATQIHALALKIRYASNVFVQTSLLNAYSKCGDLEDARKVFGGMPDKDPVSWNSLIDGHAKRGDLEAARELFQKMPERDVFSWNIMINGYSK